jgi:PST family polysaccharide transporter
VATIAAWFVVSWRPGPPRLGGDIAAMLRFGGTITLNTLVIYATYNLEKVLLGRYWGPDALGLYGRAYQLIYLPTSALNAAIGGVAFSALSRLQHDPHRFRSYFIKGYALVVSLTLPTTLFAALFAADIIRIALGPKWMDAVPIFQLLAPTILIFGIINPLAWLLQSVGLQQRSLKIALVLSPIVISAYLAGMPYGPTGIALAYSVALALWLVPHVLWCVHGTPVSATDLFQAAGRPLLAGVVAAAMAAAAHSLVAPMGSSLVNVMVAGATMALAYLFLLLFVFGQKAFYLDLLRGLKAAPVIRNEAGPVG